MNPNRFKYLYSRITFHLPIEAIVWSAGLLILALYNPHHQEHMSLCLFNNLGFRYCPGCGLGRSVSYFLHGDVVMSFSAHPAGIPAVIILLFRIYKSSKDYIKRLKLNY
jgi:hypothetical protein